MNAMEHERAEGEERASRYVAGNLADDERDEFEAHLVDCLLCLEGVESAEGLRRGILAAAEADTVRIAVAARRTAAPRRSPRFVLALAAGVALWLVPLVFLGVAGTRKDRQLTQALQELAAARAARPVPTATAGAAPVAAAGEAVHLREENARLAAALAEARAPQLNLPVLLLSAVRSAPGDAAPPARFTVDGAAAWVVLSFEVEAQDGARAYTVAVADARGKEIWKGSGIRLREEALTLALPAALLPPGRYRATAGPQGGRGGQSAYAFEVARP